MKKLIAATLLFSASFSAFATQETFTTMQPVFCSAVCSQTTTDNLFSLVFANTTPLSGPTPSGFLVATDHVDIYPADPNKLLSLGVLSVNINASTTFNGAFYIGSFDVYTSTDPASNNWTYVTTRSMRLGNRPIYTMFNGRPYPVINNVKAVRLVGTNGTTMFTVGMINASVQ
ncbi:MAG: hypothetical protein PHE55_18050 [Methylococcaceae bacterium]|nr:hypothetical protein [Methylococcaceae bacterium]